MSVLSQRNSRQGLLDLTLNLFRKETDDREPAANEQRTSPRATEHSSTKTEEGNTHCNKYNAVYADWGCLVSEAPDKKDVR